MKNKNKILALLCSALMIFSLFPNVALAASVININAEDVMNGGQNVGYYDSSADEKLETPWVADYSYMVVLRANEWVKYEANVSEAGAYNVVLRYGKGVNGISDVVFTNESTGESLTGGLDGTGSYTANMPDAVIGKMNFKAGKNVVTLTNPSESFYLDMIIIEPIVDKSDVFDFSEKNGAYKKHFLPCVIEAEDYDKGAMGSKSSDGKNSGGKYRKSDPIDIYETQKNSNEFYISLNGEEYVNYTVECEYTDVYALSVNFFEEGSAYAYIDDCQKPVEISKAADGNVNSREIYFKKGTHVIKLMPKDGVIAVDSLSLKTSQNYDNVFDPENAFSEEAKAEEKVEFKNEVYKELYVSESGSDENDGSKSSPFKTIAKARDTVRNLRDDMTGDIYVYIEPGYYKQEETLKFTAEDGGKGDFNVIYKGATPFKESVIGGGTHITGWEKTDNELWKAHYDSGLEIRNLYINDVPAIRARSKYQYKPEGFCKNENSEYEQDGIVISQKNFPKSFSDPSRMELFWTVEWMCYYRPIKDIDYRDDGKVYIEMEQPYFGLFKGSDMASPVGDKRSPFVIINDLSLLDEPGEFYYDIENETIYYYPREGESLENVYAGETEFLVQAYGTADNKLKNLRFERFSFKHGAYYAFNDGMITGQADTVWNGKDNTARISGNPIPAEVDFKHAENIEVSDCHFTALGSAALGLTDGINGAKINGNVFNDISGTAVSISTCRYENYLDEGMEYSKNVEFTNNLIRRVSYEYRASPAVNIYYATNVKVSHNDIEDVPYSGISLGWGWGESDWAKAGNHELSYNRIVNVMDTQDGAHIYTLGANRGTKIFGNYLWKTLDYRGGLYFDQGSAYMEAYNNVVGGSGSTLWLYARANVRLSQIVAHDNFSDVPNQDVDEKNNSAYNNKVEPDGADGKWSEAAQAIIDNAGLEKGYEHLYTKAEIIESAASYVKTRPNKTFSGRNEWISPGGYINYYEPQGITPAVYTTGNIGNTEEGEWEEYNVKIFNSGTHKFIIQAGTALSGTELRITIDGEVYGEHLPIPQNEDKTWKTQELQLGEYYLEKGYHIVRIEHQKNNFMFGPFKFVYGDDLIESDPEYDEGKLPSQISAEEPLKFEDLRNHWAKDNVMNLYELGIIKGVSETEFAPNREISLYETVLLAMRASGEDESKWEEKLEALGLSDKIANAKNAVLREEFCDVIMKFYADKKGNYSLTADYNVYKDFSDVSEKYYTAVWGAKAAHLMSGDDKGFFNPKGTLTRGEAATVIGRFYAFIQ